MNDQPNKRAVYAVIGFFLLVGLGMIVGAYFQHRDETSGIAAKAMVTNCHTHVSATYGTDCIGTWVVNGRRIINGPIANANPKQLGKTVSVRLHGFHGPGRRATEESPWVSIALAIFGAVIVAFSVWLLVKFRGRGTTSSSSASA